MGRAGGIDLGGTKIEARLFDPDAGWAVAWSETRPTPRDDYAALVSEVSGLVARLDARGAASVGLGAPGTIPADGPARIANLPADGRTFGADLRDALGRPLPIVNDAQAFTLSEAELGSGRGFGTVLGLVIGTGIAAGLVAGGRLVRGGSGQAGEIGHVAMPQDVVAQHGLPWVACGCGRTGCFETLASGPGLARLAERVTGRAIPAEALAQGGDATARVLGVWDDVMAAFLRVAVLAYDPDVIVLGGGVSRLPGIEARLAGALRRATPEAARYAEVRLAEGGDRSGARGAALFAYSAATGSS